MIGVFDSGLGGLTTVRALMQKLPGYDILYYGDTARMPYGSKSPETVRRYAMENTEFLIKNGAKIIIIACNSASSAAMEMVSASFDLPVFEVVNPAVDEAVTGNRPPRIGVIGTRATIKSRVYETRILAKRPDASIYSVACPLLVNLVEEGWTKSPETRRIVKKYLQPLKTRQVETLILGCTHYPILADIIHEKIGKRVRIIDSGACVADTLASCLKEHPELDGTLSKTDSHQFYVSDITDQFKVSACAMLKKPIELKHIRM